jgi:hypothetical protein
MKNRSVFAMIASAISSTVCHARGYDPMSLLESASDDEMAGDFPDYSDIGYDPAAIGYDPSEAGFVIAPRAPTGQAPNRPMIRPRAPTGQMSQAQFAQYHNQLVARDAQRTREERQAHIKGLTDVGHVPAGTIANSTAIGIGATVPLVLQSYIPLRIYRVDATAAVTATGLNAAGSVVINSFQFANRGLFDGTGAPTLDGFRPDANGRPPIRNIVVYPNTPINLSLTNNNAAAVTASVILYGSTVGR